MAAVNKKIIAGSLIPASMTTFYAAPSNTVTTIRKLTISNTTSGAVTVTIHLVPAGGSASAANMITPAKAVSGNATFECYDAENHTLNAGDSIQAMAGSAAALNIQASGVEQV